MHGIFLTALLACGDDPVAPPAPTPPVATPARWDLQASGEGTALVLAADDGATAIRLFCGAGSGDLLANVPGFRPIGSEERMSLGSGGDVVTLVADPGGDALRGGVSGVAEVPAALATVLAGPVSVAYGAQVSGPHAAPTADIARAFAGACQDRPATAAASCGEQDGAALQVAPLQAVGTEPFWGARIEGRCVTYSHPDDQKGTSIEARYTPAPGGGAWVGALGGRPFELRVRPEKACSDGMSERVYPLAVELLVGGEQRKGCAQPL